MTKYDYQRKHNPLRRHTRLPRNEFRVDCIRSGDQFEMTRRGKDIEIALCSVRVPSAETDLGREVGAAMSELLIWKKVLVSFCCRDEDGRRRGTVTLVTPDPQLGRYSVNQLLKLSGFGAPEPNCEKCSPDRSETTGWKDWLLHGPADRASRWSEIRQQSSPGTLRFT